MTNKFSVERLADNIQHKRKNTKTAAFFKSIMLKKLKEIKDQLKVLKEEVLLAEKNNSKGFGK